MYYLLKTYKTYLLCSFVLLFVASPVFSQITTERKGKMNIGFDAGIQFTNVYDSYTPISDGGIGYIAGPFFEYNLSNSTKCRIGLALDNRSFSLQDIRLIEDDSGYVGNSSYRDVYEKYKINYLTIPLSLIYVKGNNKFNFFIQGTVYYSLLISSNQSGYLDIYISEQDANNFYFEDYPELNLPGHHYFEPDQQQLNTSDIGISVQIGVIYNVSQNIGITLSPGLSYSFSNVFENPERLTSWATMYKINAGIIYTLKSKQP